MARNTFDQQLTLSLERLEQLSQWAHGLLNPSKERSQTTPEGSVQERELLMDTLEEFSNSLEELRVANEELRQQNDELAKSRLLLETERQYYQELFELAPGGYLVTTQDAIIIEANWTAAKLFNASPTHLHHKPLAVFVATEARQQFYYKLKQLQNGESINNWHLPIQRSHGNCILVSCTAMPVQAPPGQAIGLRWQLLELTSSSSTGSISGAQPLSQPIAAFVEQLAQVLDEILSSSPDLFFICDRLGQCLYVNQTAAKALGLAPNEWIGKTWQQLGLPAEFVERFEAQWKTVFETGKPITNEVNFPMVEGSKTYEYVLTRLSDIHSGLETVCAIFKEIDEHHCSVNANREGLTQGEEATALKSHLAAIAAHELRNPLNTIISCAQLIETNVQQWSDEKKFNYLQRIQDNAKQLNQLLDDLIFVGKIEAGNLSLKPALVDLAQFCNEIIKELKQGGGFQHQFTFTYQGQRSGVWDEKLLRHILRNLLLNAIHYSPKDSEIKLDVVCQDGQARFRIQDVNIALPGSDRELLFKAFHRGRNVGTVSGSGLGLVIVKTCVDLQGGEISVSTEQGVGTTFTVALPLNLRKIRNRNSENN